MSGVAIARYLLANNATLLAQVPVARIFAGDQDLPGNQIHMEATIGEFSNLAHESQELVAAVVPA